LLFFPLFSVLGLFGGFSSSPSDNSSNKRAWVVNRVDIIKRSSSEDEESLETLMLIIINKEKEDDDVGFLCFVLWRRLFEYSFEARK
jgi:hypothetical protein